MLLFPEDNFRKCQVKRKAKKKMNVDKETEKETGSRRIKKKMGEKKHG